MQIEVGKTYVCRDGSKFLAQAITTEGKLYRVQGEDDLGRVTWRSIKGRFERHPHKLDVVAETDA